MYKAVWAVIIRMGQLPARRRSAVLRLSQVRDWTLHSLLADVAIHNAVCANAAGSCASEVEGGHPSPGLDVNGEDVVVAIHICGIALRAMTGKTSK